MSQVIRIPDLTLKRLERHAIGFDTPGGVIERLLDFYEKYHHDELETTPPDLDQISSEYYDSNKVKIKLKNVKAKRKYALINLNDHVRKFFPGYKIPFILKTDIGKIETKVTSAPKGTRIGDPEAGTYIQGGLKPWFDVHRELKDGDVLTIEKLDDKLYEITIEKR